MTIRARKSLLVAIALLAVVGLIVAATPASARPARAASTQYGFLSQPNTGAVAGGSHSQSIVVLSSGTGFVEFGFDDGTNLYPFGCSIASCTKNYNASGGPGFLTGLYCSGKTGTSQWSCQYP